MLNANILDLCLGHTLILSVSSNNTADWQYFYFNLEVNMKKFISMLLTVCLLVTVTSCTAGNPDQNKQPAISYKAGTYSSVAQGHNGDVTVEVTFTDSEIKEINVKDHDETEGISDKPISEIPDAIISSQSLAVDTVSGATMTSKAILSAVEDCIKQAGADPEILKGKENASENKAEAENETIDTDVVVVGAGASGTSAALTALQDGAKVVLLEKTAFPAGAGTAAGSMFSVNSRLQKENGEKVDPEWLFDQYMTTSNYHANGALVKNIINHSSETVDWLIDNGVKLTNLPAGMQSGSEKMIEENPATANAYVEGGIPAITGLHKLFKESGGDLRYETPAFEIITNDGTVSGVKANKPDGGVLTVNAKSVIIATGGFANNPEMVKEYFPSNNLGTYDVVGGAEGDGLKMAWSAGAGKTDVIPQNYGVMPITDAGYGDPIMMPLLSPILFVNNQGVRFNNEIVFNEATSGVNAMRNLPNEDLYSIFDSQLLDIVKEKGLAGLMNLDSAFIGKPRTYVEVGWETNSDERYQESITPVDLTDRLNELVDKGYIIKADSIEELAEKLEMPKLKANVDRYNELCALGKDEDFYKDPKYMRAVNKGPFYAAKYEYVNFIGTLGGVLIDETAQACRDDGSPIDNLWVTGLDAGGMYGDSYVYFEGGTLGFAYTSGHIAGAEAADNSKK
jgi:fumarate reductase flavoprotein subunit